MLTKQKIIYIDVYNRYTWLVKSTYGMFYISQIDQYHENAYNLRK